MPKRSVGGQADLGGETSTRPIGTWVAAGLSLAVIGITTQFGVFTVYAAVLLAPMVYVFARLHGHAPQARTTSDLVGAVLGERLGVFAGLIQLVAYLLLGVKFARLVALFAVALLEKFVAAESNVPIGWFTVGSIAAVVAAGVVIYLLSTRGIAWVAAILAAVGMLVYFYVALALVALIAAGNEPRDPGISMPATPHVTYGLVDVLLAVSAGRRLRGRDDNKSRRTVRGPIDGARARADRRVCAYGRGGTVTAAVSLCSHALRLAVSLGWLTPIWAMQALIGC